MKIIVSNSPFYGINLMSKEAGIHIVKFYISAGRGKVCKSGKCNAAFEHAAHHAWNVMVPANFVYFLSFQHASAFCQFYIYITAAIALYHPFRIVMIKDTFIGHDGNG